MKKYDKLIPSNGNTIVDNNERKQMVQQVEEKFGEILDILKFDWKNDHNMKGTPHRVAKMYIDELFEGVYTDPPDITVFPNEKEYDEIIISGPIAVKSMCSHHFEPFSGYAFIGYMPADKVIGVSKLTRISRWFARRPQIQEELTEQIAHYLEDKLQPEGVMVQIKAKHYCMLHRGVNEHNAQMITSVALGKFRDQQSAKMEFLELIKERS